MRSLWADGTATFQGRHYQVDGAICRPLPLQPGGVPLWIAGGGEKKTLRIAAKYAAYTNFDGTLEGFQRKSAVLEEHCREVGTDFGAITRSANYNVIIGATQAEVTDKLERLRSRLSQYVPADQVDNQIKAAASGPLVGTPEQIADRLTALRKLGMTYAIGNFPEVAYDRSGLQLFAEQVIPALA